MNKRIRSSSTSGEKTVSFGLIPVDLFISNILSRLPVDSLGQCRCVSKLWSSIIRRPYYNVLFPIKSPAPPRILFTIEYGGDMLFYSSPQPHNLDKNTSLVATLHHRTRNTKFYDICDPVSGLVCRQYNPVGMIINPITGESFKLPDLSLEGAKSEMSFDRARYAFGYDPLDKQFKVLCITWLRSGSQNLSDEYQVLTLGDGNKNLLWRKIQCCKIHYALNGNAICINGVLYYPAEIYEGEVAILCFDVRSERFSVVNVNKDMAEKKKSITFTLIDYKGKLGALNYDNLLELWVLEDAKASKWSKLSYGISHPWLDRMWSVCLAGMIDSCKIVIHPRFTEDPFFILYYNLETNTITRVKLEVPLYKKFRVPGCRIHAFPNIVEDVKLM
ncbi:probable F-box protein At1g53815 [Capsella rubella]|uniref:probable F-box protein At1g53815 n=1 Tax=Capsella rubella TaxID=81985 RepID=UPI000CD54B2C|nr:probable F-box protein At1g53815 [Capsella rubella]